MFLNISNSAHNGGLCQEKVQISHLGIILKPTDRLNYKREFGHADKEKVSYARKSVYIFDEVKKKEHVLNGKKIFFTSL